MRLYIDGLFYKSSGIGRYYESLTKEFAKRGIKIYTCVYKNLKTDFERDFAGINNIEPIFVDYEKFSIKGFFKQPKILRKLEHDVDLFFYPHINLPYYIPKNTVVTIHDLRPLTHFWDRNEIKRKAFLFYLKRAIKHSAKIITVSNTVANTLKQTFKWLNKYIEVIYEFVDDKFIVGHNQDEPIFNKPYILFVGNRKKHKNIELLINAFFRVKNDIPHYLIIAGSKEKDYDHVDTLLEKLGLKDRVIEFLQPSDKTITNLYTFADLLVFPSLFEGFGLPPLEAVSLGCPVILSDIPVLREIFGESGLYFNPYSVDSLAEAILKVIYDRNLREELLKKQQERSRIFNKDRIIDKYIELFDKIRLKG